MKIIQEGSPNFTRGRNGKKIIAIVNHQTAGQCPGSLSWLCNPKSKASAHYLIFRDGTVYQLVKDADTAYHAGAVSKPSWKLYDGTNPNRYTIGIEHECYPAVGGDGNLTEAQYQSTLALHRQLIKAYSLPIDRDHIIGHCQIDSVNRPNCPGSKFPWDRLMKDLKGVEEVPDWMKKIMSDAEKNGLIMPGAHKPEDTATKWFVLAIGLNILKIMGRLK